MKSKKNINRLNSSIIMNESPLITNNNSLID
jgi:hypothetical protein